MIRDLLAFAPLLSVIIALIALFVSSKRNETQDIKKQLEDAKAQATKEARIESSLGRIETTTDSIQKDMKSMKNDLQTVSTRLTVVEESTKSAHHRINRLEEKSYE